MALRTWTLPTLPKATLEDSNDVILGWTAQHTGGPSHLEVYAPYKVSPALAVARTSGTTNASATVTDAAVVALNSGWLVSGLGIPAGTYVGAVTPATSYLLVNAFGTAVTATVTNASAALTLTPPAYKWAGVGAIPLTAPAAPTTSSSTSGGTLPTAITFSYAYSWLTDRGETLPSATATQLTGAGATNSNTVTFGVIPSYAIGVVIYGRLASQPGGNLVQLVTLLTGTNWVDTGAVVVTVVNGAITTGQRKHSGNNEALALVTH